MKKMRSVPEREEPAFAGSLLAKLDAFDYGLVQAESKGYF